MEELFEKLEFFYKQSEQIENELFKLTGFFFPSPHILYYKAADNEITPDDFVKVFSLMFEYRRVRREIYVINAELEEIKKGVEK